MLIGQTSTHFAMKQADKNGMAAHNVQGDCQTDGIRHAVPEADDEWITCRWEGSVLVTDQAWNGSQQRRTTRTQLGVAGKLLQDIRTVGPKGTKSAHLVWMKLMSPESVGSESAVRPAMQVETSEFVLPEPYATPSADNPQQIVSAHSEAILHSLEGFEVSLWAKGFVVPRFMLQGKADEILLSDSGASTRSGTVYVFPHGDPTQRKALLSGLDRPYGMAFWNEYPQGSLAIRP